MNKYCCVAREWMCREHKNRCQTLSKMLKSLTKLEETGRSMLTIDSKMTMVMRREWKELQILWYRSPAEAVPHLWQDMQCVMIHALYDDNALCMFDYQFIASAIRSVCITSACVYIICECHLPLGDSWHNADEYGRCTSYRSGKCLHYLLHPPPSDKWIEQLISYVNEMTIYIKLIQKYIYNVPCKRKLIRNYLTTLQLPWLCEYCCISLVNWYYVHTNLFGF